MFTFTALKSVLMAIAAQASLTVTIPNDTQITRELDRVEVIRQLEPIEPKIQMAQAKSISWAAPVEAASQVHHRTGLDCAVMKYRPLYPGLRK